jgi:TatD DNase family protein
MFVDVHCHLEMVAGLSDVVSKCISENVGKIVSSSVDFNSMKENLLLSSHFNEIECCLGLHPVNVLSMNGNEIDFSLSFLRENISFVRAIGEIGVDFKYAVDLKKREKQIEVCRQQLSVAEENSLPVVVHSRFAEKEALNVLSSFNGKVLLHWFDGSSELIKEALERNYFFSVGPAVIYNESYLSKFSSVPLENLMLETDSPVKFNSLEARPFWVKRVALKLAELKSVSLKEIERQTTRNAFSFFSF